MLCPTTLMLRFRWHHHHPKASRRGTRPTPAQMGAAEATAGATAATVEAMEAATAVAARAARVAVTGVLAGLAVKEGPK